MIKQNILNLLKIEEKKLKIPSSFTKIYSDESVLNFDTPFTMNGLYLNLSTFFSYSFDTFLNDSKQTKNKLYLLFKYKQIFHSKNEENKEQNEEKEERKEEKEQNDEKEEGKEEKDRNPTPILLGLNIIGGFSTEEKYEIEKNYFLVIVPSKEDLIKDNEGEEDLVESEDVKPIYLSLLDENIPSSIQSYCQIIIQHQGMKENLQLNTWQADEDIIISKHADNLIQLENNKKISNDSTTWKCELSGERNNLWLNLSTGYIGGGRKQWDGSGGSGAALQHYEETGRIFPLCVKLGHLFVSFYSSF